MRRAHFVVGFNNWGKTFMIHELMGKNPLGRPLYRTDQTYTIPWLSRPQPFVVQSQSNDDIDKKFLDDVKERLKKTKAAKPDLIAALCPAKENRCSMLNIMLDSVWNQFDVLQFYLLEYKYDRQAKLLLDAVESHIEEIGRPLSCHRIFGMDKGMRTAQLIEHFQRIYG